MAFSRQDARYEGRPLDLSEYSAVDMMADLGTHRRSSLPLQGRSLIITPPPPDIYKRGPVLAQIAERDAPVVAAWNAIYDPELVESREDGLGAGQMHRTGANFNPDAISRRSPPPGLRRARSAEGHESRFELGRRPAKAVHPRRHPESSQILRKVSERRRDRSPDEVDPVADLLSELRAESKARMSKYRNARPVGGIVSHHIAGNPPIILRASSAARSAPVLPHISSRIVPSNPLTSQWGVGIKLATAKAGYDYALDLDSKKANKALSDSATPQERDLNKVNKAAPQVITFAPRIPAHLASKPVSTVSTGLLPRSHPIAISPTVHLPTPVATTPTRPHTIPFPDPVKFPPSTPIENSGWAGDKPFGSGAERGLTDVTNSVRNARETESRNTTPTNLTENLPSARLSPVTERNSLGSEKTLTDLSPIDEAPYTPQQKGSLNQTYVVGNIEDTDISSEFDAPPDSNASIVGIPGSTHSGRFSSNSDEGPDHLEEILVDLQSIGEAVQELKAKYLECDGFEATLTARVRYLRRLKKEVLHEIKVDEDLLLGLRRKVTILRAKRVAMGEVLRALDIEQEIPEIDDEEEKEHAKSTMGAELEAMINEHEALMNEHEVNEDDDVVMANILEEEEEGEEEGEGKEEEEENEEEEKSPAEEDSAIENESAEKEQADEACIENKQVQGQAKKLEDSYIKQDHPKKKEVEEEKVCPQETPTAAESPEKEKLEDNHLATQLPKQGQKDHLLRNEIGEAEASIILPEEDRDSQKESAQPELVGVISERGRTIKEAKNQQHDEQSEKGCLENLRIGDDCLDKQQLEIECYENPRAEASLKERERIHAETLHLEEQLVKEHMENVRIQEDHLKSERADRARAQEERLQREHGEESRLEAGMLARKIEKALFDERLDYQRESLKKKLEDFGGQTIRNRLSRVENLTARPPCVQFEERKVWTPTPGPSTRPVSPALSVVSTIGKPPFPYNLELDLRPMYGPGPLRVQIEQFGRPQEAILKRCDEVLSSAEYNELSKIPEFQKFLLDCNERHSRRMAKAYGNSRRG